jgi:hypothetical protein
MDHNFGPGSLVLICSMEVDSDISSKTKPHYFGPMMVVWRTRNGAYHLAELDGAVSKLHYAAFHLIQWALKALQCFAVSDCMQCGALWNGNYT